MLYGRINGVRKTEESMEDMNGGRIDDGAAWRSRLREGAESENFFRLGYKNRTKKQNCRSGFRAKLALIPIDP